TDTFFNYFSLFHFHFNLQEIYIQSSLICPVCWLFLFAAWTSFSILSRRGKVTQKEKKSKHLILISLYVDLILIVFSQPETPKNGAELLFLIIPVSFIGGIYFQDPKKPRLKNLLLTLLIIVCFALGILQHFQFI